MHKLYPAALVAPPENPAALQSAWCGLDKTPERRWREDVLLISRVGARDHNAFARLYERFSRPMFSLVVHIVRCPAEAEDVVQDAFVILWTRAAGYRPELGSPFAWVAAIMRHRAIDCVRARSRHHELLETDFAARGYDDEVATGSDVTEAMESNRVVRAALAHLDGGEVRVIELAFFGGFTQSEIASALGLPLGTIKARIRRGLLKLRRLLRPFDIERANRLAT